MKEIKNSSDVDTDLDDEDPLNAFKDEPDDELSSSRKLLGAEIAQKVLKEVAIPANTFKVPTLRGPHVPSPSPSSIGSALSSVRDQSSEYETPGTSAVVTPDESLGKGLTFGGRSRSTRRSLLGKEDEAKGKGKRKRDPARTGDSLDDDALLAHVLQQAEYGEDEIKPPKVRTAPKAFIDDSDDGMEALSDFSEAFSDEGSVGAKSSRRKRPRLNGRSSLPSRSARDKATRSIRQKASLQVQDSDDESVVSDFSDVISEVNPDDLEEESEAIEDDMAESNGSSRATSAQPAMAPQTSSRAAALTAARARRQGRAPPATARARGWRARLAERLGDRAAKEREKLEKAHPEIKTMWDELQKSPG